MSQFSTTDPVVTVQYFERCKYPTSWEREKSAEAFPDFLGDDEKKTQDISKNNIENGSTYLFYET